MPFLIDMLVTMKFMPALALGILSAFCFLAALGVSDEPADSFGPTVLIIPGMMFAFLCVLAALFAALV